MGYKHNTVSVYVDVDVNDVLDELDDQDFIDILNSRGYTVTKEPAVEGFDREDWQFLLEMIDKQPETWYSRRVRDKLMDARFCD
jgi:hypothetical protein